MQLRVEKWNDHLIRFIGENDTWWAFAKDVTDSLNYKNGRDAIINHVNKKGP